MATYNTAFGALPSTKTLTGRTNTVGAPPEDERRPRNFTQQFGAQRQGGQQQPAQTFAQLQQQGMARPAPPQAPQAPQFGQFGGSQQAQQLRTQLQQQLGQAAQAPSRFDTQAFQQIRGAQQANLQAEFGAQRKALDEEMARRGLFASSVTAGRMGDLAGQQARAAADIDAQLLQRAAETQAQDRAQLMAQFQGLSELAGAQDLATFEANRVAQAAQAEQALRTAQFQQGQFEAGGAQALSAAQAQEAAMRAQQELGLRAGELTGQVGGMGTLAAQQQAEQRRQFDIRQALEQQLGLGGLSLQQRQQQAQEQQFGLSLAEQQAQRQQQFGISTQELGLRAQQLQQEAQLQGRSLTLQEAQSQAQTQLERERLATQQQQFGVSTAEQQRQFNIQQALQQQLGLGGLDVQRGELGLRQQQLQQQTADAAAERTLREQMQTRELTAQAGESALERQLRERLGLMEATGNVYTAGAGGAPAAGTTRTLAAEQQRLQARQVAFQQAAAMSEQSGVQHTVDADGNVVPLRDAQNNPVRTSSFTQAEEARKQQAEQFNVSQFGSATPTAGAESFTAQQQRIQARQAAFQQAAQISEQSGVQHTVDATSNVVPLRDAQNNPVRTSAFTQAEEARKQQAEQFNIQQFGAAGAPAAGAQTLAAIQQATQQKQALYQQAAQLSEQSGIQYTVNADGTITQLRNPDGSFVQTSAATQADLNRQAQKDISQAELGVRERLGLMEATGMVYTQDQQGRLVPGTQQTVQARQLAFQNAARLSEQSGIQYTVNARGEPEIVRDAAGNPVRTSAFTQAEEARKQQAEQFNVSQFGAAGTPAAGAQTLAAQEAGIQRSQLAFQNAARLSEQSGVQYTVNADGQPEIVRDAAGNPVRTSAFTQAEEQRKQQEALTKLDLNLRRQLGLTEATGQMYNIDPLTGQATAVTGTAGQTLAARQIGLQEAGVTGTFGGKLTQQALQNAYDRAAQLSQVTGQQYTVDPQTGQITAGTDTLAARLQQANVTGMFGGNLTQQALQNAYDRAAQLSQITGTQYTVDPATGQITAGKLQTFTAEQAGLERDLRRQLGLSELRGVMYDEFGQPLVERGQTVQTQAARQADLDRTLRQALGMSEATGFVYDPTTGGIFRPTGGTSTMETVAGQQSRSDLMLRLAQSLSGMTQQQIADFLGRKVESTNPTPPGGGTTTTSPPTTTTKFTEEIREGSYIDQNKLPDLLRTQLAGGWQPSSGAVYAADGKYLRYDGTGFYEVVFQNGQWVRK